MTEIVDLEIPKYFHRKFWEWEAGEQKNQRGFAEYLGVAQGTLGHWMNGRRKPDYENCLLLSKKLGPEIFNVCGYLGPDPQFRRVASLWHRIDGRGKSIILETVMEAINQNATEQINYRSEPSIPDE